MSAGFGKVFQSMYDGTIVEHWQALVTFQQMIVLKNPRGEVDMTPRALSNRTGIPIEIIEAGLAILAAPDPKSRSKLEDGRRIVPIERGRDWGWRLVNHEHYRNLLAAEDKKEADRARIAEKREQERIEKEARDAERQSATGSDVSQVSQVSPIVADVAHTASYTDTEEQREGLRAPAHTHARESDTPPPEPSAKREPTTAARACLAMREAGCARTNPSDPDLLAALAEGVEPQTLADCAREAIEAGTKNPFRYAIAVARSRHAEGPAPVGVRSANSLSSSNGRRRLSVVEQVERDIAERREREAAVGNVIDGTCERVAAG